MYKQKESRKGKTRNLFRKTGLIKGTFCPKMGMIKDRNCRNLVGLKRSRRDGKNTENYTKKILMTWVTMMVWSELDILECEVKWALGSAAVNKTSG